MPDDRSKQLWLAKKKVYFFIVWANENSDELCLLAKIVDVEYGKNFVTVYIYAVLQAT